MQYEAMYDLYDDIIGETGSLNTGKSLVERCSRFVRDNITEEMEEMKTELKEQLKKELQTEIAEIVRKDLKRELENEFRQKIVEELELRTPKSKPLQGPAGPPGPKGIAGRKGDKGLAGNKGSKGEGGKPGQQGLAGSPGNRGPRGDKGAKGDPGTMGKPGQKGEDGYSKDRIILLRRGQFGNNKDYFAKTWSDYEAGFGTENKEFWLGLRKMYQLTRTGTWELLVTLQDYDGKTYTASYSNFRVADRSDKYRLTVSNFNADQSTLEDKLSYHDSFQFSTKDQDNDESSGSCSTDLGGGGGWWYNDCDYVGLTGINYFDQTKNDGNGIQWDNNILPIPYYGSWPVAQMEIRRFK